MSVSPAKENILKKIRQALSHSTAQPFPQSEGQQSPFEPLKDDNAVIFAERFSSLQGKFVFCDNNEELLKELQKLISNNGWSNIYIEEDPIRNLLFDKVPHFPDLATCDASITGCECLVARTGSVVISSKKGGRAASVYAPVHVTVAYADQLLPDIRDALSYLKKKYPTGLPSSISFATGPSRTADIEKTLVTGVHGPKEVYCFLVDIR
jgi:L-lactate dehydrogenase complex protein LldG